MSTTANQSSKHILVLGNKWHGNFSHFLCNNLRKRGYTVDEIDMLYTKNSRWPWQKLDKYIFINRLNKNILNCIVTKKINLIIGSTPFHVLPDTWNIINKKNIDSIVWFGDNPMWKPGLFGNIESYKAIFLPDEEWVKSVNLINNRTHYLPHAADETVFYPIESIRKNPKIDILFVGHSYYGTADGILRAKIINEFIIAGLNVTLYGGSDWKKAFEKFPSVRKHFVDKKVSSRELNELYNASKIVLNIHHTQEFTGTNQRTFEAVLAGTFVIADYKKSIEDIYKTTNTMFTSIPEAISKAKHYLKHDTERIEMINFLRKRVLENHTYNHRITYIFKQYYENIEV
jgi:spore maturation protein CgeB